MALEMGPLLLKVPKGLVSDGLDGGEGISDSLDQMVTHQHEQPLGTLCAFRDFFSSLLGSEGAAQDASDSWPATWVAARGVRGCLPGGPRTAR